MKQAIIVLTLWILSQDAKGQSAKLEGYSRNDVMFVSTKHSGPSINRQPIADMSPNSFLSKTETATPVVQKARPANAEEKALQESNKALWANTKALEENTKALEENTKALKENTEMMRRLLESGQQYAYVAGVPSKMPAIENRMQAAKAVIDHPVSPMVLFAADPLGTSIPAPASVTVVKPQPQPVMASATLRPATPKMIAPKAEQIKQNPAMKNGVAKANIVPAIASAKNVKPQIAVAKNIAVKSATFPGASSAKTTSAPRPSRICFLNGSSYNSSVPAETATAHSSSAKSVTPKAWSANTAIKMHAPKASAVINQPKKPIANAVNKTAVHENSAAGAAAKVISVKSAVITKTAAPHTGKISKPSSNSSFYTVTAKRMHAPHAGALTEMEMPAANNNVQKAVATTQSASAAHAKAISNTKVPKSAAAQPAQKMITPVATTMPMASALTKTPAHVNIPVKALPAKNAAEPQNALAAKATVKPQASAVNIPLPAAAVKPAAPYTLAKAPLASTAPAIMAPKPHAADENKQVSKTTATARASMSAAIQTGMIGQKNKKVSLSYLLQFPLLERSFDYQMRNENHLPKDPYSGFKEGDMITTHGYISLIAIEDSGKQNETYYIQLVANPYRKDSCLNIRITADKFAGDARKQLTANARQFVKEQLLNGKTPSHSGNVIQNPVFVTITGELVYNSVLAGAMRGPNPLYKGKKGVCSYTPWEITNVNRIQFSRQ